MAVTPQDVIAAFEASQAAGDVGAATEALGNYLAPLFNGGGGGAYAGPVVHIQSSAATDWLIPNPFGRFCAVELLNSAGNEYEAEVIHAPDFSSLIVRNAHAATGRALLS